MFRFAIKRLATMIPTIFVIATLTFFVMRLAPGGPFDQDNQIPDEIRVAIEAKFHLDRPLWEQYLRYMWDLLRGDVGPSFRYESWSVNEIIAETLPISMSIGLLGLFFAIFLGVSAGLIAASKPYSFRDYAAMIISIFGICMPSFVIGPILVLIFAIKLEWFHVSGLKSWQDFVLPAMTLAIMYSAYYSRLTRAGILEISKQDFIRTARAKGLGNYQTLVRHALKIGLLPAISFSGSAMTALLTGSLVVEQLFNIPGIGRLFVQSALNRDYTLAMGTILLVAVFIQIANLIVDLISAYLDPRIRYD
jgi:oligopeptide transport system permease protein